MKNLLLLLCLLSASSLHAKIWQVGPTRLYTIPSAVAALVANGDTVEIDAGLYTGNVAKWYANNLVIRGVGNGYAHLEAAGANAEGKAIWVIKGADCTVEGIEFSGCQVPDHNGAGIRQEGKNLTLRHCFFHHNEMGILTSNDGVSDFLFESCEFASNGYGDGYSHNIYVGVVHSLTMRYCYSHDSHTGHLVKSRAQFNYLSYNRFTGEVGDGSYEVDMPNGGQAVLVGNMIEQCATSQNGGIISFGLENQSYPIHQIALSHNTIVNDRFDGRFVQVSNATTLVKLVNNVFLGPGTMIQASAATLIDTTHNLRFTNVSDALLMDPANFDYRPQGNSPCVNAGIVVGDFNGIPLTPFYMYLHPLSYSPRWYFGTGPDAGAFERLTTPYRMVEDAPSNTGFQLAPNPVCGSGNIRLEMTSPLLANRVAFLFNAAGERISNLLLEKGQQTFQWLLEGVKPGFYFLFIPGMGQRPLIVY